MSFGFGVGDIILISQLSYKLYSTITSGRRDASRELKELEDVLFGLRCALDHLRHVAKEISEAASATAASDSHGLEMQQSLDQMVQNCAMTLEDLDSATKKYREGTKESEDGVDAVHVNPGQRRMRLKSKIQANVTKIRWDLSKDSLRSYRDKLQSHIDNINLVLNTFHWSTTEKIHAAGKLQAQKLQDFQDKILDSNSSMEALIRGMHDILVASKDPANPPSEMEPRDSKMDVHASFAEAESSKVADGSSFSLTSFAHRAPMTTINMAQFSPQLYSSTTTRDISQHFIQPKRRTVPLPPATVEANSSTPNSERAQKELPPEIVTINLDRRLVGAKALESYKRSIAPKPRPTFMEPRVPTIAQLREGVRYIFSPLPKSTPRQLEGVRETRAKEVRLWVNSLDHLLDSLTAHESRKSRLSEQQGELIDMLAQMNGAVEESNATMRDNFYSASSAARFDAVLDKLLTITRSVRGQKEVEEFIEEREDWKEDH